MELDLNSFKEDEVSEIWYKFLNLECIPEGKFLKITNEEMNKGCQCKICFGLVLNPVACLCPDEKVVHLIGKECAKKNFSKEKIQKGCPNFQPLNIFCENEFVKDELNNIVITCPFCAFTDKIFRVRKHVLQECQLDGKMIPCPFPECKEIFKRSVLRTHLLDQIEKHLNLLKDYGLDTYLKTYIEVLAEKYNTLTKDEVKGI